VKEVNKQVRKMKRAVHVEKVGRLFPWSTALDAAFAYIGNLVELGRLIDGILFKFRSGCRYTLRRARRFKSRRSAVGSLNLRVDFIFQTA
jgi:hypothetical protein